MATDRNPQGWLIPAAGEQRRGPLAEVAVCRRTWRTHAFNVPPTLAARVQPGARLQIPFGPRRAPETGWCVAVSDAEWDNTRRLVLDAIDEHPLLSPSLLALGLWVAEYYHHPPGPTLDTLVPEASRTARPRQGWCVRVTAPAEPARALPEVLAAALERIAHVRTRDAALRAGVTATQLARLRRRGHIELFRGPLDDQAGSSTEPAVAAECPEDRFELTPAQQDAVRQVDSLAGGYGVSLLFGVPGSGKTEVYVRAIRATVQRNRQAILLVPEIALATQVLERLARRFPRVAVLHSRMTPAERQAAYHAIRSDLVDVVIGTRTAVFAPCTRLGLIVVDEEQESSYKNFAAPFYHARDVAILRANRERIPVLLGSATPSLESWHNAHNLPDWRLLRLGERPAGARLPTVRLIDTRRPELRGESALLTRPLESALRATLDAGEQALLLHNRRGYAQALRCGVCGLMVTCERCAAHLVLHQPAHELRCHRCGWRRDVPTACVDESCGGPLQRAGLAIQRLEQDLLRLLPGVRLLRADRDTMRSRERYSATLQQFERREADVLIGTQMIAKGLDFPGVRLVGVLDADAPLRLPDFRAAEQTFQLLVQVVGRAGRRAGGGECEALLQVSTPEHPVVRASIRGDYEQFAAIELEQRRMLRYPPFGRLARIVCLDERPGHAQAAAERIEHALSELAARIHAELRIFPAGPCPIPRLREWQRFEVLIRGPRGRAIQQLLARARDERILSQPMRRMTIDVDPLDLL